MNDHAATSRQAPTLQGARFDLLCLTTRELDSHLADHFATHNQPDYRVEQVRKWVYDSPVRSFDEMTNLPTGIRLSLAKAFFLAEPDIATVSRSSDGTAKHLWLLADGGLVESVLIPDYGRLTLCLSSQAGCALGCTFCATGWAGFSRQLDAGEIVTQYRASLRWALENGYGPITNIVYMGMGEPLANLKAVHASLTILNQGFRVGARKITVSTVGLTPGILELAARPEQFGLALSLHAPISELRQTLIPLERRHPLHELMAAVSEFRARKGRRVTFEYTMIRGINDSEALAPKLAHLARSVRAFVNLIPFNPIPYQDWLPSDRSRIEFFRATLDRAGVSAAIREPRGRDINAACGQLRASAAASAPGPRSDPNEPLSGKQKGFSNPGHTRNRRTSPSPRSATAQSDPNTSSPARNPGCPQA